MTGIIFWIVMATLTAGSGVVGLLVAGYRWGRFTALRISHHGAAKWRAYAAALVPAAGFSLALQLDSQWASSAAMAFLAPAAAAIFGVLHGWDPEGLQTN